MGRRERNISKTREERIAEWLGATKLTEAQVKEWMELGMCMSPVEYWDFEFTELPFHLCKKEDIAEQLASEKGEVAMEKAVRAMGYYLISWAKAKP